jgi:GTP diphosphokinase / guanosine-3',5'-bis(diphosphate) 3'-diphosphatase
MNSPHETLLAPALAEATIAETPPKAKRVRAKPASEALTDATRQKILKAYKNLVRECMDFTGREERLVIRKAFEFALATHGTAMRKSGEPYILHPIAVARIVIREMGVLDVTAIVSALLHDVVEDTFAEVADISRSFGGQVADIVEGLTKISVPFDTTSSKQAENYRKMLLTMSHDIRVALVKIADRLHNMRTLEHMRREKQLQIAAETHIIYAPLAHRLGFMRIRSELEDLSLKYREPDVFKQIDHKLKETKSTRDKYIQTFIRPIRAKLKEQGYHFRVFGRVKSISSIYSKMQRQNVGLDEVYDIFAVRIVLDSSRIREVADCWQAYSIVTQEYWPHPERIRDWISVPRPSGYESLHTTVMGPKGQWVEVQIRSERMDFAAEKGLAAHWKYKEGGTQGDAALENWLQRIREVLENQQLNAQDFVSELSNNLIAEQIYVFTPRGDMVKLPTGATALDFAYEIHTDIGNHAIGAKVNHLLVPLSHKLRNGDQVEIISSKVATPKAEWKDFAVTSKALSKINETLRDSRKKAIAIGRLLFDRKMRQLGIIEEHELVRQLLNSLGLPTVDELLFRIGNHTVDVSFIQKFITENEALLKDTQAVSANMQQSVAEPDQATQTAKPGEMTGEEMQSRFGYRYATCCHPVPGDEIVGYLEPNNQIAIHRAGCPRLRDLLSANSQKLVRTRWNDANQLEFRVTISIRGQDRQGMMSTMLEVISKRLRLNIRSLKFDTDGGLFEGRIRLDVLNTRDIENLVKNLRQVPGIFSVQRV